MNEEIKNKGSEEILNLRKRAWFFYDNDMKVFIVDAKDSYYSGKIISISETAITFRNTFGRVEEDVHRLWIDIKKIEEFKPRSAG